MSLVGGKAQLALGGEGSEGLAERGVVGHAQAGDGIPALGGLEAGRAHEAVAVVAARGDVQQGAREALSNRVLQTTSTRIVSACRVV